MYATQIKGGAVRDTVILGLKPNDIDLELPASITQGNWRETLGGWVQALQTDYQLRVRLGDPSHVKDPSNPTLQIQVGSPFGLPLGSCDT